MAKMVQHGGFTRVSLLLDNCDGLLTDAVACEKKMKAFIARNQMRVVGGATVSSALPGCSGYQMHLILLESFVMIETWPEINRVKAIVDICDFNRSNQNRAMLVADKIKKLFAHPKMVVRCNVDRDPGVWIDEAELAKKLTQFSQEA